jgi:hypothetical protein
MNDFTYRLKKKGWTDDDIQNAVSIINKGRLKKPKQILFLDSIIYWIVLFVALIGNFIISVILIPFMITLQGFRLYSIIIIISFSFGAFFDLLIRDIEKIQQKDIIIAGIFLPLLAIINVSFMVKFSNFLQTTMGLNNSLHNPLLISLIYVVGFVSPYMIRSIIIMSSGINNIYHKI